MQRAPVMGAACWRRRVLQTRQNKERLALRGLGGSWDLLRIWFEDIFDLFLKKSRDFECERQAGGVLAGFQRVHGLPRYAKLFRDISLRPVVFRAQDAKAVAHLAIPSLNEGERDHPEDVDRNKCPPCLRMRKADAFQKG